MLKLLRDFRGWVKLCALSSKQSKGCLFPCSIFLLVCSRPKSGLLAEPINSGTCKESQPWSLYQDQYHAGARWNRWRNNSNYEGAFFTVVNADFGTQNQLTIVLQFMPQRIFVPLMLMLSRLVSIFVQPKITFLWSSMSSLRSLIISVVLEKRWVSSMLLVALWFGQATKLENFFSKIFSTQRNKHVQQRF